MELNKTHIKNIEKKLNWVYLGKQEDQAYTFIKLHSSAIRIKLEEIGDKQYITVHGGYKRTDLKKVVTAIQEVDNKEAANDTTKN